AYIGDANFSASTSTAVTQTVNKAATTSTVTSSATPAVFGQSVTFTVTVSPTAPGAGTPTGTVTFRDGTATLGTSTLTTGGQATSTISTLSVATHTITVVYGGDNNFTGSTSAALTQTLNKANTTTTVSTSINPALFGQATITATVAPVAPSAG